jgi:hypothetical protein
MRDLVRLFMMPALVLAAVCSPGEWALSQTPINLTAQVIHASNQGATVDPALAKIRSQLASLTYTNYRLLETHPLATRLGAKHAILLPGGRTLDLYPYGLSDGRLELLVTITEGAKRILDTTVRLSNNNTIVVGGPSHAGGVLIVALTGTF